MAGILQALILAWALFLIAGSLKKDELEKRGIEILPIGIIIRTERGIEKIKKLAIRFSGALKIITNTGIFLSPLIIVILFITLGAYAFTIAKAPAEAKPGLSPVIPGVEIPGSPIFVPLWPGIIAIVSVVVVHEFMHALLAVVEDVRISSFGIFTIAFLPIGAFVEPDEDELAKKSLMSRLRVYIAGSAGNFIAAIALLLFLLFIFNPIVFTKTDVKIMEIAKNSPAEKAGFKVGEIIISVNGIKINSAEEFLKVISQHKPGEEIIIETNKGLRKITLGELQGHAYIGIGVSNIGIREIFSKTIGENKVLFMGETVWWSFLLNFFIGLTNLLPVLPFDGGRMLQDFVEHSMPRYGNVLKTAIFLLVGMLIIINFFPYLRYII